MTAGHFAVLLRFKCFFNSLFGKVGEVSFSMYIGHWEENVYSIIENNLIIKNYTEKKIFSSIETL